MVRVVLVVSLALLTVGAVSLLTAEPAAIRYHLPLTGNGPGVSLLMPVGWGFRAEEETPGRFLFQHPSPTVPQVWVQCAEAELAEADRHSGETILFDTAPLLATADMRWHFDEKRQVEWLYETHGKRGTVDVRFRTRPGLSLRFESRSYSTAEFETTTQAIVDSVELSQPTAASRFAIPDDSWRLRNMLTVAVGLALLCCLLMFLVLQHRSDEARIAHTEHAVLLRHELEQEGFSQERAALVLPAAEMRGLATEGTDGEWRLHLSNSESSSEHDSRFPAAENRGQDS